MKRILLSSLVAALALTACTDVVEDRAEPRASFPSATPSFETGSDAVIDVVDRVLPAVVNVVSETGGGQGEGTGFIVRSDGVIVTNWHVVEGATSVAVLTSEEEPREFDARVIGGDVQADLAVLDVEARGLPTVPLGDSEDLQLGQQVVAIGYALGLEGGPSVTTGIVSSLTRQITVPDPNCRECEGGQRVYTDVIQTDAAINPGNSGGPLVDLAGRVVGINSAGTTTAENIGFAIQIDSVKPTIFHAADNPDEPVAFMGIGSVDADDPQIQFQLDPAIDEGAAIVNVVADGPADLAGIRVGDIVVAFGGRPVASAAELGEAIRAHEPGDRVEVLLVRGGERTVVTLTLGVNPVPTG
ncbi:MAG TPA: trypsin-like peptidase domain-containing protein [Actinomycetota bacterium]